MQILFSDASPAIPAQFKKNGAAVTHRDLIISHRCVPTSFLKVKAAAVGDVSKKIDSCYKTQFSFSTSFFTPSFLVLFTYSDGSILNFDLKDLAK